MISCVCSFWNKINPIHLLIPRNCLPVSNWKKALFRPFGHRGIYTTALLNILIQLRDTASNTAGNAWHLVLGSLLWYLLLICFFVKEGKPCFNTTTLYTSNHYISVISIKYHCLQFIRHWGFLLFSLDLLKKFEYIKII